jgi:hypothetical protein
VYDFTPKDGVTSYYMLPSSQGDHTLLLSDGASSPVGIDNKLSQQQKDELAAEGVLAVVSNTEQNVVPRTRKLSVLRVTSV